MFASPSWGTSANVSVHTINACSTILAWVTLTLIDTWKKEMEKRDEEKKCNFNDLQLQTKS